MIETNYQVEKIAKVSKEIMPLLRAHFEELSAFKDINLRPLFAQYHAMEKAKKFCLFTVRVEGTLVGYAGYFVSENMHYGDSLQAVQDVLYIAKEHRGHGLGHSFIKYCDESLGDMGVQLVYHHVKDKKDFGPMLESMGYKAVEKVYVKRLD